MRHTFAANNEDKVGSTDFLSANSENRPFAAFSCLGDDLLFFSFLSFLSFFTFFSTLADLSLVFSAILRVYSSLQQHARAAMNFLDSELDPFKPRKLGGANADPVSACAHDEPAFTLV